MFISSRIQEGIADYIPSLNQGLAVLTNSTVVGDDGVEAEAWGLPACILEGIPGFLIW